MRPFCICCILALLCKNECTRAHDLKSGILLQVDLLFGSAFSGQKTVTDLAKQMVQVIINKREPAAFKETKKNPLLPEQQKSLQNICAEQIKDHGDLLPAGEQTMKVCSWQEGCRKLKCQFAD